MRKLLIIFMAFYAQFGIAQNSLLYKVEGTDIQPSYLFGTIHLMPQKDFVMQPKVKKAFKRCDEVYLELDMDDPNMLKEMMGAMNLKNGKTLDAYMDDDEYSFLDAYFTANFNMSLANFKTFKPFYLSSMLLTKMIGDQVASYEMTFVQMAKTESKELKGLETVAEQIAVFDTQPLDEQIDDLIKMIKEESSLDLFNTLIELYKKENVDALYTYMDDYFNNDEVMINALLLQRNKNWADKIPQLSKETSVFYAVGAGHLGGRKGVLQLLKDKGYIVTPIFE
ncbi:TraB/GumN family protein [Flavobacteriaceae bacterium F08102]|nr:TraB/GumN family protein [Flavobacteriaceae bacterium F08102]